MSLSIVEKLLKIKEMKENIKIALEKRGMTPSDDFSSYAEIIDNIKDKTIEVTITNGDTNPFYFYYYDLKNERIVEQSITTNESFTVQCAAGFFII